MKVSTVVSLAAPGFSGITHASSLFNNTCQHFDIHDLDGKPGRAVRLYAECKNFNGDYVQTNLDLNTCFGWADCQFAPYDKYDARHSALPPSPPSVRNLPGPSKGASILCEHELMAAPRRDFSHTCNECGNAWHEQDQFGQRFGESCDLSHGRQC